MGEIDVTAEGADAVALACWWESAETVAFFNPGDLSPAGQAARREAQELAELPAAAGLVLFRTSGSEGRPKWIGHTRAGLRASAEAVNAFLQVMPEDRWLRALPRFHVGGFGVEARAWVAHRVPCATLPGKWSAEMFWTMCHEQQITLTTLVPTQVFDLVRLGRRAPASLRAVIVGGGELRPALFEQARALGWPVRASYGLTEAASMVAAQAEEEQDCSRLTVLPHWEVRVGEAGTLQLRGPARAVCRLWRGEDQRWHREEFPEWLPTADRVALRELPDRTELQFLGRRDRVVKRLGELVNLTQVEQALADAAVALGCYGAARLRVEPDERAGSRLVLECLPSVPATALCQRMNAELPPFAQVAEIHVTTDLRMSPLGKPVL